MSKSWGEIREEALRRCGQLPPKTNADRIRSMTDEELAEWLPFQMGACNMNEKCGNDCTCDACWFDWLKREVDTDG